MFSLQARRICSIAIALVAMACFAAPEELVAATPATTWPDVTYTASGVFASPPISGNDLFQLQGQPFDISVVANMATVPKTHGAHWGIYGPLPMVGTVQSRLLPTPITISNNLTNIALATGNPSYDVFQLGSPIKVAGLTIRITAVITMPKGTITRGVIQPFTAPVTLSPANATLSYTDGTNVTVLGIQSGTLNATIPGAAASTSVLLHSAGAQAITMHGDGTRSVRSIQGTPVALGDPADTVALQFYASGVRDASDVHVQIAGQEVPVLYAGVAGHFPGLDQVSVQVPRSLAGKGDVDILLTVGGQTAKPVHIFIQ